MSIYPDWSKLGEGAAFYNRRAERAAKRAKVTRLLSELFGPDNVRGLRVAFDPFSDYVLTKTPVAKANRLRKNRIQAVNRSTVSDSQQRVIQNQRDLSTPGDSYDMLPPVTTNSSVKGTPLARTAQPVINYFSNDATERTRPFGVEQGEFEKFRPRIYSTSRSHSWKTWETLVSLVNAGGYSEIFSDERWRQSRCIGPSGRITQATVDAYLNEERTSASLKLAEHGYALAADARPTRRSFNLLREIAELKDLPRLLRTIVKSTADLVSDRGVDISDAFLSKEFGWDPTADAVLDLVNLPTKIAKRVNYLLSRRNKETTFRSRRHGVEATTGTGGFVYDPLDSETNTSIGTSGVRFYELRCVTNCVVKFPEMEIPMLRDELRQELWGLRYRPADLYNLVPWTWLVDWFTGIGDYIDAIGAVDDDQSLINWGLITYSSETTVSTTYSGKLSHARSRRVNSGPIEDMSYQTGFAHTSVLKLSYQKRTDLADTTEVKHSWAPTDLTAFQAAILGALLTKGKS
jgi:hypothetical protein